MQSCRRTAQAFISLWLGVGQVLEKLLLVEESCQLIGENALLHSLSSVHLLITELLLNDQEDGVSLAQSDRHPIEGTGEQASCSFHHIEVEVDAASHNKCSHAVLITLVVGSTDDLR